MSELKKRVDGTTMVGLLRVHLVNLGPTIKVYGLSATPYTLAPGMYRLLFGAAFHALPPSEFEVFKKYLARFSIQYRPLAGNYRFNAAVWDKKWEYL